MIDETLKSSVDLMTKIQLELIIIFSLAILISLSNLIFYFIVKHSPDFSIRSLIPSLSFKKGIIRFLVEDTSGRELRYTKLIIYKNEKIYKISYNCSSRFKVFLPKGIYEASLNKFGFETKATNKFVVDDKPITFELIAHRKEDIAVSKTINASVLILLFLDLILGVILIVKYLEFYTKLPLPINLVLLISGIFFLYLTYRFFLLSESIKCRNFKDWPLKNEDVEIFSRAGQPIKKVKTNERGSVKLLISPGTYKFVPEKHSARIVRVFDSGTPSFKIKF